jgi:hypothetical protein
MRRPIALAGVLFLVLLVFVIVIAHSIRVAEDNSQRQSLADLERRRADKPFAYILSPPSANEPAANLSLLANERCVDGYVVLHTAIGDVPQRSEEWKRGQLLTCKDGRLVSQR